MKSRTKGILRVLSIGALLLLVAGVGVWRFGTASGVGTTLSIAGAPASVSAGGSNFQVEIRVAAVSNLASYEWRIQYDPAVVELTEPPTSAVVNGSFLGGTGRGPVCELLLPPNVGLEPGEVRFGCATVGASPPGPSGAGLLSTVVFRVVASGSPNIQFVCAALADPLAEDIPIDNVPPCVSPVTPTATPPGPSPTPGGPTVTPGGPTATVGIPTATVTIPTATVTPTGPVATPTQPGSDHLS
jgi:hypothetical protein